MWPGHPPQEIEDRQPNSDQHAVEHAEPKHGRSGGQRQQQFAATEPAKPAELRDVDEPKRGEHHQGAKGRHREILQEPRPRNITATTEASATNEYTWVRLPTASPSAVRLPLELTGKPCVKPVATLQIPRARSSALASMLSPLRAAKVRPVSAFRRRPPPRYHAGISIASRSAAGITGTLGVGRPAGISPTTRIPWFPARRPPPRPSLPKPPDQRRRGRTSSATRLNRQQHHQHGQSQEQHVGQWSTIDTGEGTRRSWSTNSSPLDGHHR